MKLPKKIRALLFGSSSDLDEQRYSPAHWEAESVLDEMVQCVVSTNTIAQKKIREGNGRVIAMLQKAAGKSHGPH